MLNYYQSSEIGVGCALVAIAVIAVALRFYAKQKRKTGLGLDDWLSLVSLALIFTLLIELLLWATVGGNGQHMQDLTPDVIVMFFKVFYANEISYVLCTPCIKLCIMAFYRQIFATPKFRLTVNILACFTMLFSLAFVLAAIFQCSPIQAAWNKELLETQPGAKCFNGTDYFLAFQSINIALDITILCLPLPMIWGLHRAWQDKLALTGVFLLGGFVCAASIYRIATLFFIDDSDVTFTLYLATVWTFVEPCIGLTCACLPIIRGLLPSWRPGTTRASSGGASSSMKLRGYRNDRSGEHSAAGTYHKMGDNRSWSPNARSQDDQASLVKPGQIRVETRIEMV